MYMPNRWFEPYVCKWFIKNTYRSLNLAKSAYRKDKKEKVLIFMAF